MKGTVNEETQQNPQGEYECTKATSDYLVETSGIPFSILRPSIVFGEGMVNQSFLQFANAISTGRFFFIGKRGALLNYIHVNDVARALQLCGTQNEALGNDFIISETIDIEQFVQIVQKVTKSIQRVHRLPKIPIRAVAACIGWTGLIPLTASRVDALTRRSVYDSSKIQGQLGFEFKPTLEERIKSFVFNHK
jgi:nucleoside-diphosphate-sugar epimerase